MKKDNWVDGEKYGEFISAKEKRPPFKMLDSVLYRSKYFPTFPEPIEIRTKYSDLAKKS